MHVPDEGLVRVAVLALLAREGRAHAFDLEKHDERVDDAIQGEYATS